MVGGAVRNALLGEPVHEVDVTTTAIPDVIIARAKAAGLRAIPTGIEHGTITILCEGEPFEATTLREDVETHGRHATVRFGRDFRADALRRDFTINQLSVDAHGVVHDYAGGLDDIAARRVRFIGDAQTRVREDYLRILRFFRFHAAYADGAMDARRHARLHRAAPRACGPVARARAGRIDEAARRRRAAESVEVMTHAGIMGEAIAGVPNPARLARVKAIEAAHAMAPDAVLRLAGARACRWRRTRGACASFCACRTRTRRGLWTPRARSPHGMGATRRRPNASCAPRSTGAAGEAARDGLVLAQAESRAASGRRALARRARVRCSDAPEPKLPVSGADFIARGLQARPGHGRGAEALRGGVDRGGFSRRRGRDRAAGGRGGAARRPVMHKTHTCCLRATDAAGGLVNHINRKLGSAGGQRETAGAAEGGRKSGRKAGLSSFCDALGPASQPILIL